MPSYITNRTTGEKQENEGNVSRLNKTDRKKEFMAACVEANFAKMEEALSDNGFDYVSCRPLAITCEVGNLEVVCFLLTSPYTTAIKANDNHSFALDQAAYYGQIQIVDYLLNSPETSDHAVNRPARQIFSEYRTSAGPSEPTHENGNDALRNACANDQLPAIDYLVSNGHVKLHEGELDTFSASEILKAYIKSAVIAKELSERLTATLAAPSSQPKKRTVKV